jgi:hypothetical protein
MAAFSTAELARALTLLSERIGFEQLKDRLARHRAFTSKRGLGSVQTLADRLYMLSGGLRRESAASYGFQTVWSEVFLGGVTEVDERELGEAVERINACLTPQFAVAAEKTAVLDEELGGYHRTLARCVGDEVARLDMLMKAVPAVAERIRSWAEGVPPPAAPPSATPSSPSD